MTFLALGLSGSELKTSQTFYIVINVRVCDSPKIDTPESNSMQRQKVFYSAKVQHAGVSPLPRLPPMSLQARFKAH